MIDWLGISSVSSQYHICFRSRYIRLLDPSTGIIFRTRARPEAVPICMFPFRAGLPAAWTAQVLIYTSSFCKFKLLHEFVHHLNLLKIAHNYRNKQKLARHTHTNRQYCCSGIRLRRRVCLCISRFVRIHLSLLFLLLLSWTQYRCIGRIVGCRFCFVLLLFLFCTHILTKAVS